MGDLAIFVPTRLSELSLENGEHILSGSPQAAATKALLRFGDPLVSADAEGTYLGGNVPLGFTGDVANWQIGGNPGFTMRAAGGGGFRVGIGVSPVATWRVQVEADANDINLASVRVNNPNAANGNAAAAALHLRCGGDAGGGNNSASGFLACYAPTHASALLADRLALNVNSDAAGISFIANESGQDVRIAVGALNEQYRFSSAGELLIGTTSSLARLAVVGRADQIQSAVRAIGGQIQPVSVWQDSGGTARVTIGSLTQVGDATLTLRQIPSQSGAFLIGADSNNLTLVQISSTALTFNNLTTCSVQNNTSGGRMVVRTNGNLSTVAALTLDNASVLSLTTGGTQTHVLATSTFAPTSGGTAFRAFAITPTINQTGGANGDYTGLLLDVTETAAGGSDNRILDLRLGGASRFAIGSDGRAYVMVPNSAPVDSKLANSQISWYLDEAVPAVKARVRKSDGTYLTLTIANGVSPTLA